MAQQRSSLSESFIRRARESPRRERVDAALRTLDIALSLLFLVVTGIPMVVITLAILATSGRPILYRGERVGRGGEFYTMLKFRTLRAGAEERLGRYLGEELVRRTREERTTVGRWLRATQLDELPQLLNVLRGDMSLVGPRPLVIDDDCRIEGWDRRRLHLTPGMTGPWQITGVIRPPLTEMVKLDYLYVATWSLWGDVKIILRTIALVLARRGL